MRRHYLLLSIFVTLVLFTGCDLSYTVAELWMCNESGQSLYVESEIVSEHTSEKLCFPLESGDENKVLLAKSPRYEGSQSSYLPLSHCIKNEDAKVSIYTVAESGEKLLVRTWYYSNRNNAGRELFNEKCLSRDIQSFPDGGCFPSFTFIIIPEDLKSH